jgi:hypothetical protein
MHVHEAPDSAATEKRRDVHEYDITIRDTAAE